MTLEQQSTKTETYEIRHVNHVPTVLAQTERDAPLPEDGDGLVGTVKGALAARRWTSYTDRLDALEQAGYLDADFAFRATVVIPPWRRESDVQKPSEQQAVRQLTDAQFEAKYAAHAIGQAAAVDAITKRCLTPEGAARRVLPRTLADNTSNVGLYLVKNVAVPDSSRLWSIDQTHDAEIQVMGSDDNHGPYVEVRFPLATGYVYAAHRPFRLERARARA